MTFAVADAILGSSTIRQIRSSSHKDGLQARKSMYSGGAAIAQISGNRGEEITSVTSGDCGALAGLNTSTFCSAGLWVSGSSVTIPYKGRSDGAQFASGSSHSAIAGTKALIIPTGWSVQQDSDEATCDFEVHWVSATGAAKAATGSTGNALASQDFSVEYGMGEAYINGSEIVGVQGIRVNPGITLVKKWSKGLLFPTQVCIQSRMPTIELTVDDIDEVVALVGSFSEMTSANVYFRKRAAGSSYVADATPEHLRFTFAAGLYFNSSVDVQNMDNGSATITLHGKSLTANNAVAIP